MELSTMFSENIINLTMKEHMVEWSSTIPK